MSEPVRVALERARTWVFATALDWPGWCRRGKGDEGALEALDAYAGRYARVAGAGFDPGAMSVLDTVAGNRTTDFGAPAVVGPWDEQPLDPAGLERFVTLLEASWRCLDAVVAAAPAELVKGPRGGGRERDAVADHVREAERSYGRKLAAPVPPRRPWPEQRVALTTAMRSGPAGTAWPLRYCITRCAWHVLDHAWEIEDRSG